VAPRSASDVVAHLTRASKIGGGGEAVGARGASGGGPSGCALLDTGVSGVGAFACPCFLLRSFFFAGVAQKSISISPTARTRPTPSQRCTGCTQSSISRCYPRGRLPRAVASGVPSQCAWWVLIWKAARMSSGTRRWQRSSGASLLAAPRRRSGRAARPTTRRSSACTLTCRSVAGASRYCRTTAQCSTSSKRSTPSPSRSCSRRRSRGSTRT
jgi:hypothetical protein